LKLHEIEGENTANGRVLSKLYRALSQKIAPLLSRRVHSNLQDLSLLAEKGENPRETVYKMPVMRSQEIVLRWVRSLSGRQQEARQRLGLEQRYRDKYMQTHQMLPTEDVTGSPKRNA
jgi:hypothetical protein